jgi:hypothetical protein
MSRFAPVLALAAVLAVSSATADTLTVNGTADDFFKLYISTDLANPGAVLFDKNSGWGALGSTTLNLQPGQSVYLLIDADNTGGPGMFVADFTLSGGDLRFANGLTTLTTDTTNWTVSQTSFASATAAPVSMGQNLPGLQIWGQRAGISSDALAIWAYNADWAQGQAGHSYFVTQITAPVPEPATALMWLAGAGLLTAVRRRAR